MFSRSKTVLSYKEKEFLWQFLKDPNHHVLKKPQHHKYTWLKCSGAFGLIQSNPGYYEALKYSGIKYPNPSIYQIELDLRRTFPNESPEKINELILPLRNVLCTYLLRNPSGVYC